MNVPVLPEEKGQNDAGFIAMKEDTSKFTTPFLQGALLGVIFNGAIKGTKRFFLANTSAIPDDLNFRMKFVQIFQEHSFLSSVVDEVYDSILRDFPNSKG